ncbi:hypothetical protein SEVIR_5G338600v4 [Setaria viridis]|uniref:Uncharacterized protein n=1 Tax=Setaria viridis TaxID=4556 RepID=A0A4V6D766_SETVI|nr:general transcription factor IIF subunit 2 [Setaria italica]XP_034593295.1 general transcription factor IIF subunit 2-like [Setaria viridis]TKW17026.1 hypothetical protein SEVIR_5G338600v2 [Setaria viridis]
MAEEVKPLETARADRPVWLMKCPTVVSRAWQEAAATSNPEAGGANPNPVVAKVILSLDPLRDEQPTKFKMEMAQANNGNTPKSYSLNMYNDFVPMCIFSESNQGKYACEGKVENKFDMKPHSENLANYGKLCRERTTKSMDRPRVEVLVDDHGNRMRPMPGLVGLMPSSAANAKEKKKPASTKPFEMKRTRRDRKEMENILFKLFERQPNWSLKQLMQETDQPEQFLKEILNDLCVYNKRGPNQGTHELKPEYKKSTEDNSAT